MALGTNNKCVKREQNNKRITRASHQPIIMYTMPLERDKGSEIRKR